jgi:hypothetical protein
MFFSVEAIRELTLTGWHTKPIEPIPPLARELLALKEPNSGYDEKSLHSYLQSLPDADEQGKIVHALQKKALQLADARMSGFRWWDICPGEHWLMADMYRDHSPLLVGFTWKTVKKGSSSGLLGQTSATWLFDKDAPRRARFHFEQPEYHSLIASFERWLQQPLPAWPHWALPAI